MKMISRKDFLNYTAQAAITSLLTSLSAFSNIGFADGKIKVAVIGWGSGKISSAHAYYGHLGPTWSAFFYEQGGRQFARLIYSPT